MCQTFSSLSGAQKHEKSAQPHAHDENHDISGIAFKPEIRVPIEFSEQGRKSAIVIVAVSRLPAPQAR